MEKLAKLFSPPSCATNSFFISFEGIEGAGKSSHINQTKVFFENLGYEVLMLREPGGTTFGESLRTTMLSSSTTVHPLAEAHLFASSRAQLLYEKILPFLAAPNRIVIADRFIDSSLAYQGVGRNLGLETILKIHSDAPLTTVPHLTIYIKISLATSFERQATRNNIKDYFESESAQFYQKLIAGYDQASAIFPNRIKVIDGTPSIPDVYKQIERHLKEMVSKK